MSEGDPQRRGGWQVIGWLVIGDAGIDSVQGRQRYVSWWVAGGERDAELKELDGQALRPARRRARARLRLYRPGTSGRRGSALWWRGLERCTTGWATASLQ